MVKEIFAERIRTDELCVGNTCVNESQLQELLNKTQTPSSQLPVIIESPTDVGSDTASTTVDTTIDSGDPSVASSTTTTTDLAPQFLI